MSKVMLCVPNFSEGRRSEVVEAIVAAIREAANVNVFNVESDPDHNRSVVAMLGAPEALEDAMFAGIQKASELIDMDAHEGEHPRMGATDVVPFIPVRDVAMEDCVETARRLGKRVGETLGIPVYLYEAAASRPERTNLAKVRKGQYEAIKAEIGENPDRAPDFGPSILGKAGATAIGARHHLVAFNVYLDTDDVEIAKKIAITIRESSGGLPYVKAIGLLVGGLAQVSMNLTNVEQTPIHSVVDAIRAEAAKHGVGVSHSELIGVAPQKAFFDAAASYLQLDLDPNQVLETHLMGGTH
jgi:glutamate formiminotransferase